jgi:hypothetical protein
MMNLPLRGSCDFRNSESTAKQDGNYIRIQESSASTMWNTTDSEKVVSSILVKLPKLIVG